MGSSPRLYSYNYGREDIRKIWAHLLNGDDLHRAHFRIYRLSGILRVVKIISYQ